MKEFRCSKCNKLLGKIEGRAEIVCPRCKELNTLNSCVRLIKKPYNEAVNCFECDQLRLDDGFFCCLHYHNVIITDVREKNC